MSVECSYLPKKCCPIISLFSANLFPCSKRPKLDQVPAASLDADDPLDEDDSDDSDDEDDTAALLAELQRIKKERAVEQALKVGRKIFIHYNLWKFYLLLIYFILNLFLAWFL